MGIQVEPKHIESISSSPVLQQTAYWAKVKEKQGCNSKAYNLKVSLSDIYPSHSSSGKKNDDLLVIIRNISEDRTMAYVPYGPAFEPEEEKRGHLLEELSESLRPHLPDNCLFIRFDLKWQSPWINDKNRYNDEGRWMGEPDNRIREMRMNFDTTHRKLYKAPTDVLPAHTVFLDLGRDNEEIMQGMKPKTRYNIRLSYRKGVYVKRADTENLSTWYGLYRQTAHRNSIYLHNISYFRSVIKTKAKNSASPADVHLLIAEKDKKPLAGMFLVISKHRATYLYGASSNENRHLMGTYALQWAAIEKAKSAGCREYDMFGISGVPDPSHPMYGLYRFKTGFGGSLYHRQGCWDYPLEEKEYNVYRMIEMNSQGYHLS